MSLPTPTFTLGKNRLEALSDGVFSIAMTLLVLELKVPDFTRDQSSEEVFALLAKLRPVFFTFCATFLISGAFWYLHHLSFHFIKHTNRVLCWLNLFFLLFVSLLPFSASLWGRAITHPVGLTFYYGNQLALALLLLTQWFYARRKGLADTTQQPRDAEELTWRIASMATAFAAALTITQFRPDNASIAFVIVVSAMNLVSRIVMKKRYRRPPASALA